MFAAQSFQDAFKTWWNGDDIVNHLPSLSPSFVVKRSSSSDFNYEFYFEALEEIWGTGFTEPGGIDFNRKLLGLLKLNSKKIILNLNCGLGGAARDLSLEYKVWIDAYEQNNRLRDLAFKQTASSKAFKRMKVFAIDYNVGKYDFDEEKYHYAFTRDSFFTIKNKELFLQKVAKALRVDGDFIITDYALGDGIKQDDTEILDFIGKETTKGYFCNQDDYKKLAEKTDLKIRNINDYTEEYIKYIINAWHKVHDKMYEGNISSYLYPYLLHESITWLRRYELLKQGKLKYLQIVCQKKVEQQ